MESSSKQIQPARDGGYGQEADKPQDGLANKSFRSRCPPMVTPDSIIIAVCGPNDYLGNAAPDKDGWFFSDFYLFHHLFRGTAKQQYWLTCVSPTDLVQKYQEFVHGDPGSSDRRVVLDKTFAKQVDDVLIFHPDELLERFLSYITNACEETKVSQRPILILIFGHGQEDTYSITIGGAGKYEDCPVLTQAKFKEAIYRHNPSPNIALLTTSCFGGGWAQTSFLNIRAMAGVNERKEILSWPESASLSRCCGSRYADGVAVALIRSEIKELDEDSDERHEVRISPIFHALVEIIHDILVKEVDIREGNSISFSAQDDLWGKEWRARTGFPLETYEQKWKSLRVVEQGDDSSRHALSASVRFSDTIYLSVPEAEFRLKRLAIDYLKSNPGDDSAAKNHHVHNQSHALLKGKHVPNHELEFLAGALRYRLKIMARATEYKDRLNISFPDCQDCDKTTYWVKLVKNHAKDTQHGENWDMVGSSRLFDPPEGHEGMPYVKGTAYLALVFTASGWSRQRIEDALSELVRFRSKHSRHRL